jgi:hypothetical protein
MTTCPELLIAWLDTPSPVEALVSFSKTADKTPVLKCLRAACALQVGSFIAIFGTYLYSLASDRWSAEQKAAKAKNAQ